jgi:hypothetical protein
MSNDLLASAILPQDALMSSDSIKHLHPYITDNDRSLIFLIGTGTSMAGNSRAVISRPVILLRT